MKQQIEPNYNNLKVKNNNNKYQTTSTIRNNINDDNNDKKIIKTKNYKTNITTISQDFRQLQLPITSISINSNNNNVSYNNKNVSNNNGNYYLKQQPYIIPIYLLPRIIDRALTSILQDFLEKILYSFFQQKHPTPSPILSSAIDSSIRISRLLTLLAFDKILPIILPNFTERIGHDYLSKLITILFSKFVIKNSKITPKHRWLSTKSGILKTNSNQVSTLSVRFNSNPPILHLFNKSSQEQVPVLQIAGPSKGKYSRAELEEHREFMLTKIHIAMRKKKWKSVKRLIIAVLKTFNNY